MLRHALLTLALLALAAPATAAARLIVIASGDANATLADVSSSRVINRVAVPGASPAVVVAPRGSRAFLAAGRRFVAIGLARQAVAGAATAGGVVRGLAVSTDG